MFSALLKSSPFLCYRQTYTDVSKKITSDTLLTQLNRLSANVTKEEAASTKDQSYRVKKDTDFLSGLRATLEAEDKNSERSIWSITFPTLASHFMQFSQISASSKARELL